MTHRIECAEPWFSLIILRTPPRECTLEKALPGVATFEEGLKIYSQWNSPQDIERWGFMAIFFQV